MPSISGVARRRLSRRMLNKKALQIFYELRIFVKPVFDQSGKILFKGLTNYLKD
jgi:hypothetical protein